MIIGIDLGTTNSAMAYIDRNGNPQVIANREGERMTPSVILFDGDNPVVGSTAKSNAIADPLNVVQFIKRQMANINYRFVREDGESFTPEELSAIILKRLKKDAEEALGETVDKVVVTVPAYFDDAQRKATQDAGAIAGLHVLKVINEPTAAALAYGITKANGSQNIMVFDLGGGTFDVTVMSINESEVVIKATGGDRNLGGFDFDNAIIQRIVNEFEKQFGVELYDDEIAVQDLREKAEACKKTLSNRSKAIITLSSQGYMLKEEITREQFDEMTSALVDRTVFIMNSVLEDSGLSWERIDRILLVGGSTRIKSIQESIEKASGKKPSSEINPDEAVAIGAAIQACILEASTGNIPASNPMRKVTDVNSHSLGILAADNDNGQLFNSIILPRNTPLPAEAYRDFFTRYDNQEYTDLEVTEGEDDDPEYVRIIGTTRLYFKKRPAGSPIRVIVSYDDNSVIHVRVIDLIDNEDLGEMDINRTSNLSNDDVHEKANKLLQMIIS